MFGDSDASIIIDIVKTMQYDGFKKTLILFYIGHN